MSLNEYVAGVVDIYMDNVHKIRRIESPSKSPSKTPIMAPRELRRSGKGLPVVAATPAVHVMEDPVPAQSTPELDESSVVSSLKSTFKALAKKSTFKMPEWTAKTKKKIDESDV